MIGERLRWMRTKLNRVFRRDREEAAMETEMQFHFDQLVAEFRAEGMTERDALLAARREFGATDVYREEVRDVWCPPALVDAWRSVVFALRSLARTPGFTFIAILTLGLGIGANTSMFNLVNGIVIKPLPYAEPDALESIFRQTPQNPQGLVSAAEFLEFRSATSTYESVLGYASDNVSVAETGAPPAFAEALRVSANFFDVLGVQPGMGRGFRSDEETQGRDRVVVLSQRYWRNQFGSRTDIIGQDVRIDGEPHEVIGVMPNAFNDWRHLGWVDLFRPLAFTRSEMADRAQSLVHPIGRRAADVTANESAAEVSAFGERMAHDYPASLAGSSWTTLSEAEVASGTGSKTTLAMLVGLSGFVLLIACSNLANFLLARTMSRAREFAVRAALGASRGQLLRPLLIEAVLLALLGGLLAVLVATGVSDWLAARSTGDNGEQVVMPLNWIVLGWAFLASLVTAVAFALAPALFALRLDLNETLKCGGRGSSGSRSQHRFRQFLIVGQFALAMVLLSGATLFIYGLNNLNHRRSGWDSDHVVTGTFLLPDATYATPHEITAFQERALEQLRALPGVAYAGLANHPPFFNWAESRRFIAEGQIRPEPGREPAAMINAVTPGYLATVGTTLVAGRLFDQRDQADSPRVFVINQSMANTLFPDVDPIGRRLARITESGQESGEVIGVVEDVRNVLPEAVTVPFQLYVPMAQEPRTYNEIAVRLQGAEASSMVPIIRALMSELDPDLPIRNLQPAEDRVFRANYQLGVLRDMLTGFAVLGLALASLGIYGVIARTMAQRTGEFGIRLALGAQVSDITRLVLGSGVRLALIGAALGTIGGIGLTRLIAMGFPNMHLHNPWLLVASVAALATVGLLASYLPARRAARINPVDSLRAE